MTGDGSGFIPEGFFNAVSTGRVPENEYGIRSDSFKEKEVRDFSSLTTFYASRGIHFNNSHRKENDDCRPVKVPKEPVAGDALTFPKARGSAC